jgi:hypothetical protein
MPDDHERAITNISEMLDGKVVSRTFKMHPAHFFDRENEVGVRRQSVTEVPDKPPLPPVELPEIPSDMRLDWKHDHWAGRWIQCIHCGRHTLLHDDARRQSHKICAESALAALLAQKNPPARHSHAGAGHNTPTT